MSETTYSTPEYDYLSYPFLHNKYYACYIRLIQRCLQYPIKKIRGYTETHHILPTSMGGNNRKINKIVLTTKEHFIAHALLIRCTEGQDRYRMVCAMDRMCTPSASMSTYQQNARIGFRSSLVYVASRREFSKSLGDRRRGRKQTPESNEKRRQTQKGRKCGPCSPETRAKISLAKRGVKQSSETIAKRAAANRHPRGKYNVINRNIYKRPEMMQRILERHAALTVAWRINGNSGRYPAGWRPEEWNSYA